MLYIPTFVAPSPVAGLGLFAAAPVPAGTCIWAFTEGVDWRLTDEELRRFPEPYRTRLRHYLYLDEDDAWVLCGDNARFMNHHTEPNCSDANNRYTMTLRNVEPGEELTCDYMEFDLESQALGLPWERPAAQGSHR